MISREQCYSRSSSSKTSADNPIPSPPRASRTPHDPKMYDTLCQVYYWPQKLNDAYRTVKDCQTCNKEVSDYCPQRRLNLFPATGSLELVAIEIARAFSNASQGNQFVVFKTNRYSELARPIATGGVRAPHILLVVLNHWFISYGIPDYLLSDNGARFVSKFFSSLCTFLHLQVKKLSTTVHHPQ